ncbi:MAG TPA: hypothetical protein VFU23_11495 [Gemmatimonadales bacterium]|nr:hypothetical protein [Gemmatimonadales bacterium]
MPGWVGPTAAIALVIIALSFAAIATAAVMISRKASTEIGELSEELAKIRGELSPALSAIRRVADAGADLSGDIREEVNHYLVVSRGVRKDLEVGVRKVKRKLSDLDALYEVVHEEVEDTALDVAAGLRSVRNGAGMVGRIRRWLVRR